MRALLIFFVTKHRHAPGNGVGGTKKAGKPAKGIDIVSRDIQPQDLRAALLFGLSVHVTNTATSVNAADVPLQVLKRKEVMYPNIQRKTIIIQQRNKTATNKTAKRSVTKRRRRTVPIHSILRRHV